MDHTAAEDFRVVQLTLPGSTCSVTLMRNDAAAGSLQGLHLVVTDYNSFVTFTDPDGTGWMVQEVSALLAP